MEVTASFNNFPFEPTGFNFEMINQWTVINYYNKSMKIALAITIIETWRLR